MGTVFAPICANLAMGYHEIQVYYQPELCLSQKTYWKFLVQIFSGLSNITEVNLIKPERLPLILNQINNNIQFTVEKSQTKVVQKSG